MLPIGFELLILLLLALVNGAFALTEIAVVSARPARLEQMSDEGQPGAAAALELIKHPGPFLSTVQIGITLIGVMAGAFGGTTVGVKVGQQLAQIPAIAPYGQTIGIGAIVLFTTYFSLVVGELAPKRLALTDPERLASLVAAPMQALSRLAGPIVRMLELSTLAVLRLVPWQTQSRPPISEDEIRRLVKRGTEAGTLEREEQLLIERVFRLADRRVASILTPRPEIVWLDLQQTDAENWGRLRRSEHSRFPVCEGGLDAVVGVVEVKDLLELSLAGESLSLSRVMREPVFIPESAPAIDAIETFRRANIQLALVLDEYGGLQGLVTSNDVLQALTGDPVQMALTHFDVAQQPDGSLLVDGLLPVEELRGRLGIRDMPGEARGTFETVGGFLMMNLEQIPQVGDAFSYENYRFEVVKMDGLRVAQVRVTRL